MRLVGIVLAILMVAACPPRRGRIVYVQPCPPVPCVPAPVQPVTPPPQPEPVVKPTDPVVESYLQEWEKKIASIQSLRAKISLKRTDATSKTETNYTGEVLWLKPNYFILRLDNADDTTKTNFESYICDGKSLFVYDGAKKIVTEIKPPQPWPLTRLSPSSSDLLAFFAKPNAKAISERFDVTRYTSDDYQIYLDIKARSSKDAQQFDRMRLALLGPKVKEVAYLPKLLYILKPNDDTEVWKFEFHIDIPGLRPEHFKYVELKGWKLERMGKPEKP